MRTAEELATCLSEGIAQAAGQAQLARQLVPLIAGLSLARDRCAALAGVWAAVTALELDARRAARSHEKLAPPLGALKGTLSHPFIMEAIAGGAGAVLCQRPVL